MNESLRKHVTSAAFVLTLRQSHMTVMVWLDLARKGVVPNRPRRSPVRAINQWVQPISGCTSRGLVEHFFPPVGYVGTYDEWKFAGTEVHDRFGLDSFYKFTAAGEAVLALLQEAGFYDEMAPQIIAAHKIEAPV